MRRATWLAGAALAAACPLARAQDPAPSTAPQGSLSLTDGRFVIGKGVKKAKDGVIVQFEHGEVFVPQSLVRDYFSTDKDFLYEPKNDAEKAKLERGLIPIGGHWMTRAAAEKKLEQIQQDIKDKIAKQADRKKWRNAVKVETRTFKFVHNLPDELFDELKELLEVYYDSFTKYWGKKTKLGSKPTVNLYSDQGDFDQIAITGGSGTGVVGYYHLFNHNLHVFWDRTDPEFTVDVLFHEANHMLSDMINGNFRYPHWIEEPMAEYYGASKWDARRKRMELGAVQAGRLAEIKGEIGENKWMKLKDLVGSRSYRSYTWGWSFVHFMMESDKYQKKWKKLYLDLAHKNGIKRTAEGPFRSVDTEVQTELLLKYLGHKTLDTLEKEWHAYLKQLDVEELDGYERAGRKLRTMGKFDEARKYLEQAVTMGSKSAATYAAFADILGNRGSEQPRAIVMIDKALELDPLEAEYHYQKGEILRRPGPAMNVKKAKQCFLLASEIAPDNWKYAAAAVGIDG